MSVYELATEELSENLAKALQDGEMFEMLYNYKAGYDPAATRRSARWRAGLEGACSGFTTEPSTSRSR